MIRIIVLLSMLSAGIVHLLVTPDHFGHAPAHGIFFVAAGMAEIAWALAFWHEPSKGLYYFGLLMAGGLVALWAITRVLPSPFEGVPGAIDFWGVYSKTAELMAIGALIAMSQEEEIKGLSASPTLWRRLLIAMFLASFSGTLLFGAGQAAETLLPSLAGEGHVEGEGDEHDDAHD